jgi:uncharacterized protein YpuA (DUF1002 family)
MKKILAFLAFSSLIFSCQTKETIKPEAYNDSIVSQQSKIARLMIDMAHASGDIAKAQELRQKAAEQAETSLKVLERLGPYKDDNKLLVAAQNLFTFYRDICNNEFKELYELAAQAEPGNPEVLERMKAINQQIADKEAPLDEAFAKAQKEFAEKYGIKITENAIQKEIDALNQKNP